METWTAINTIRVIREFADRPLDAEHLDVTAVALAVALEDLDRRRLAGAVGTEQAEHLAGADLEALEGDARVELQRRGWT